MFVLTSQRSEVGEEDGTKRGNPKEDVEQNNPFNSGPKKLRKQRTEIPPPPHSGEAVIVPMEANFDKQPGMISRKYLRNSL